jgi:hypothetical protein
MCAAYCVAALPSKVNDRAERHDQASPCPYYQCENIDDVAPPDVKLSRHAQHMRAFERLQANER